MDPNETLKRLRELIEEHKHAESSVQAANVADGLPEQFQALDGWLSKGGALPEVWGRTEPVATPERCSWCNEPLGGNDFHASRCIGGQLKR